MMEDKDGMCRVRAAEAVWKITKEADAVLGTLTAGLKSDEEAVARVAIVALREMGAAAEPVISEVTDALKSNDKAVRRDATLAIGSFARTNTAMIPLLIAALEDSESDVRRAAVDSLVRIGPPAAGAVEQLKKMGQDEVNIAVRRAAGNAARQIESGEQPKSRRRN
jgi:HEAT repeat protein